MQSDKQNKIDVKIINLLNEQTSQYEPYILSLDLLGKGQFGTVYKAVHKMDKKKVYAVKAIQLKDQKARHQIQKELEIIQHLPESPNIIKIEKHHIQSEKNVYIFQEYCQGGSLQDFRQQNDSVLLSEQVIFDLFNQLVHGYLSLYQAGIIHEDIKPSNIMIKGHLYKFCDFGVSEFKDKIKQSNVRNGTISYMAPDKLRTKYLPNASSDIFSLGVTIYEVIFGVHPYNIDHSVKDYKIYLKEIKKDRLRSENQLMDKVKNASAMFYPFLKFLEKMIALRLESRATIQDLKYFIENNQPFKSMSIPVEQINIVNEGPDYMFQSCNINIVEQSAIHFVESKFNNEKLKQEKNKLLMKKTKEQQKQSFYSVDSALMPNSNKSDQGKRNQQEMRKEKQQQKIINETRESLQRQHKIIRSLTNYLRSGHANLIDQVFPQFQKKNKQCCREFLTSTLKLVTKYYYLKTQNLLSILRFLILKFNLLLFNELRQYMRSFIERIIQSSQQISLASETFLSYLYEADKDVGYYESQLNSFLAQNQVQNMTDIVQQVRQWNITKFSEILIQVYKRFFEHFSDLHEIRNNFKYDILNGIFLVQVDRILNNIKDFYETVQVEIELNKQEKQNVLQTSKSQPINTKRAEQIYDAIKIYNECTKKKLKDLKIELGKQFKKYDKVLLSSQQQNQDEFEEVDDQFLIELGVNLEINDRKEQFQKQKQMIKLEEQKLKNQ